MSTLAAFRLGTRLTWIDRGVVVGTVVTPVGMALAMPALMRRVQPDGVAAATSVFVGFLAMILAITTFMSILHGLTTRRDQLILRRLRTTLLTERQILTGEITGHAAHTVALVTVCTLLVPVTAGVPLPRDPLLLAVFVAAGAGVMAILGAAATALVPRAEFSTLLAMPVFLLAGLGSGAMGSLVDLFPSWARTALELLPTDAVVAVARVAYAPGTLSGDLAAAAVPAVKLLVWGAIGLVALRLWFRWDPRRS